MNSKYGRFLASPALYLFLLVVVALYWLAPHATSADVWHFKAKDGSSAWKWSGGSQRRPPISNSEAPGSAAVTPISSTGDPLRDPTKPHVPAGHPAAGSDKSPTTPSHESSSSKSAPLPDDGSSSTQGPVEHPIKLLHQEARVKYESMLSKQSTSLTEAVAEYIRRYKRKPPPGFDKWYDYAVKHKSVIIDDFDIINDNLAPYWKVDAVDLRNLVVRGSTAPMIYMLSVTKGEVVSSDENWMGARIRDTLGDVAKDIPDFEILMNPLDEPRILLRQGSEKEDLVWHDAGGKSSYEAVTKPCKSRNKHSSQTSTQEVETQGIPFMTDIATSQDICRNPKFAVQHGFFIAPTSFITTESPVPVLSQSIPSTFSDIIYPSMWYWDHTMHDLAEIDIPWDKKRNKMYWAGSTTGGYQREHLKNEPAWESHRHRFIRMTKQIGPAVYSYLTRSKDGGSWTKYESEEIMSQMYDTKFTKLVQCDGDHCEKIKKTYKFEAPEPIKIGFQNKFLMDLDGNSFSGRFYNFLASNSCAVKQTIFREWHDERIVPWVHYIPISVSLEELPEAMRYLTLTTEGSQIAKEVAALGQEYNAKLLRREDAAIYLFRLFLEYARVVNGDRDNLNFDLEASLAAATATTTSTAADTTSLTALKDDLSDFDDLD